eukprot:513046-Pleurochrysis_carterae.AAC.1
MHVSVKRLVLIGERVCHDGKVLDGGDEPGRVVADELVDLDAAVQLLGDDAHHLQVVCTQVDPAVLEAQIGARLCLVSQLVLTVHRAPHTPPISDERRRREDVPCPAAALPPRQELLDRDRVVVLLVLGEALQAVPAKCGLWLSSSGSKQQVLSCARRGTASIFRGHLRDKGKSKGSLGSNL